MVDEEARMHSSVPVHLSKVDLCFNDGRWFLNELLEDVRVTLFIF